MSEREVRPWDMFNKNMKRVPSQVAIDRLTICQSCEFFRSSIKQCTQCGCIMTQKTKLADASCPVHKWNAHKE